MARGLFLAVGLLGGQTTFSNSRYHAFALLRQGHTGPAGLYLVGRLLGGLGGAAAGWRAAGLVAPKG